MRQKLPYLGNLASPAVNICTSLWAFSEHMAWTYCRHVQRIPTISVLHDISGTNVCQCSWWILIDSIAHISSCRWVDQFLGVTMVNQKEKTQCDHLSQLSSKYARTLKSYHNSLRLTSRLGKEQQQIGKGLEGHIDVPLLQMALWWRHCHRHKSESWCYCTSGRCEDTHLQ